MVARCETHLFGVTRGGPYPRAYDVEDLMLADKPDVTRVLVSPCDFYSHRQHLPQYVQRLGLALHRSSHITEMVIDIRSLDVSDCDQSSDIAITVPADCDLLLQWIATSTTLKHLTLRNMRGRGHRRSRFFPWIKKALLSRNALMLEKISFVEMDVHARDMVEILEICRPVDFYWVGCRIVVGRLSKAKALEKVSGVFQGNERLTQVTLSSHSYSSYPFLSAILQGLTLHSNSSLQRLGLSLGFGRLSASESAAINTLLRQSNSLNTFAIHNAEWDDLVTASIPASLQACNNLKTLCVGDCFNVSPFARLCPSRVENLMVHSCYVRTEEIASWEGCGISSIILSSMEYSWMPLLLRMAPHVDRLQNLSIGKLRADSSETLARLLPQLRNLSNLSFDFDLSISPALLLALKRNASVLSCQLSGSSIAQADTNIQRLAAYGQRNTWISSMLSTSTSSAAEQINLNSTLLPRLLLAMIEATRDAVGPTSLVRFLTPELCR
jgi:hypothetical protein